MDIRIKTSLEVLLKDEEIYLIRDILAFYRSVAIPNSSPEVRQFAEDLNQAINEALKVN